MKIYVSRLVPARNRADHVPPSRTRRKALAFGAVSFAVLLAASLLILGRSVANAKPGGAAPQATGAAAGNFQTIGTISDVMVSMVYPAANNILLSAYRGVPQDDKEWLSIQRNAVLLAESGNVLLMRSPAGGQSEWAKDAKMLVDAGAAAYNAARAKDANALMAVAQPLNASCTACHKQYRANIAGPGQRVGPSHQPAE
jgi:hypothetical protein